MIINISEVWRGARFLHKKYLIDRISHGLAALASHKGPGIEHCVYSFITTHKDLILASSTVNFDIAIKDFENKFRDRKKEAKIVFNKIFDYAAFVAATSGWSAYELCSRGIFRFCPYCHLSGIETRINKEEDEKYRPNLDHFLGKADYPFLALTLANLIPCCEKCNGSQMKGRADFYCIPHLNPLTDKQVISFSLLPRCKPHQVTAGILTLQANEHAYKIHISIGGGDILPAANSIKTFQLKSRYQSYTHDALSLARQVKASSRIDSINKVFPTLDLRAEDYTSVPLAGDYRNSHAGKMRLDILRQFG